VIIALRPEHRETKTMELMLEAVALFALKLAHEENGGSPVLRDDPVMSSFEREVFGLLVRQGQLKAILLKIDECVVQALAAVGGADTVLGRELKRLSVDVSQTTRLEDLPPPLDALQYYLKAIQ
jgi:hypothetical protein